MVSRAEFTLGQLAEALGATLEGDAARLVRGVAPLESAGPDDVSFLTDARYHPAAQAAPQQAMIDLLLLFHPAPPLVPGVHPSAIVAADARVDATAAVGPLVVIEAGARVGPGARVGALTYLGPGVVIEDDVEIGANCAIDRATFGDTIVRRGTKIDNLVQIGHNVEVGEHSILVAQVGVSGSSRLGRGVVLAGQVGVADH